METTKYSKSKENKSTTKVEEPMAVYYTTAQVLHQYTIKDDYSLIKKAQKGLGTEVFYSFANTIKMPEKTLAAIINLSQRTISNYRDQNKHLDANYSEHLLKLINLYGFGKDILGSLNEFNLWLNRPFWNSNEKPIDFISTSGGVDLIYAELEKLAQGYPV
jgi:putative toxin-antitoxin system antitoxin component (TIGR02293 family)